MPETKVWALKGPEDWEAVFPLQGDFETVTPVGRSPIRIAFQLEQHLAGTAPRLPLLNEALLRLRGRSSHFPDALRHSTVVHCPYQIMHPRPPRHWDLPYVINLHDLQHEHYPEFFSAKALHKRRVRYLASACAAMAVCVVDEWTKRDVLAHLPIPESKLFVAPFGPTWGDQGPLDTPRREALFARYGLPETFAFYPAQTWPHKNHLRLLEALHLLKTRDGLMLPLIFTGHQNDHFTVIQTRAQALGIEDQLHFLGLVPSADVQDLYRTARMTVIPTLFEGGPGIPVLEAMALGSPLVASRACGIPDAVGEAGLLFDPENVQDMASALLRFWRDDSLRAECSAKAQARSALRTWDRAAETYADIYSEALHRWNSEGPTGGTSS